MARIGLGPGFLYWLGKKPQLAMDIQVRKKIFVAGSIEGRKSLNCRGFTARFGDYVEKVSNP
jgi:hypothetical protein